MRVSELARRAGLSASGVRWYEAAGILPAPSRRSNGYREYTEADLSRLTLVLTLRRLGLSPSDAGALARGCIDGSTVDPSVGVALDAQHLVIARQREALERLEAELRDLETTLGGTLARPGDERLLIRVLFVCNGNSARSQMAEALLARQGGGDFAPASAGTRPKPIHPLTGQVLAEIGIDWATARSKSVREFLAVAFDYVVTLSDSAREECPVLPGPHSSLHWHLDDPAAVEGSADERLEAFRLTRTELLLRIRPFVELARRAATGPSPRGTYTPGVARRARPSIGLDAGRVTQP